MTVQSLCVDNETLYSVMLRTAVLCSVPTLRVYPAQAVPSDVTSTLNVVWSSTLRRRRNPIMLLGARRREVGSILAGRAAELPLLSTETATWHCDGERPPFLNYRSARPCDRTVAGRAWKCVTAGSTVHSTKLAGGDGGGSSSSPHPHRMRPRNALPVALTIAMRSLSTRSPRNKSKGRQSGTSNPAGKRGPTADTAEPVLTFKGVSKLLPGGRQLFRESNLSFVRGAKVGVLGMNGSGKSTVLKILAGQDKDYDGELWTREGLKVKYLPQEPKLDASLTVMDNIRRGIAEQEAMVARFEETGMAMGEPHADLDALLEEQATLQAKIEDADAWNLQHRVEIAMQKLRVPPRDSGVGKLSGGEKRRVALCTLLLEQPDVILLDEPTNHLDAESVRWLEDYLRGFKGTVISITHDRYFLDNVAGWILEVDRGDLLPYEGNYSAWLLQKQKRLDVEHSKQAQMAKRLESELKWIRNGRASASKARSKRYEKAVQERKEGGAKLQQLAEGAIVIPPGPRLGRTVLSVNGLSKSYGDRTLFDGLSFMVDAGSVVGVVGPNGSGKTTLFNLIAGLEEPDEGTVEWGSSVKVGLVSQGRGDLDPQKTAYEEIAQGQESIQIGDREISVRTYTAAFNLKGAAQEKLVGSMSGGERNRVHLAKVLKEGHNVLLLDEPTNDLDVETLRSLEDAIHGFAGSVLIVSHDRWFLDRVCSHTIAFEDASEDEGDGDAQEGESKVVVFPGNHGEYARQANRGGALLE